MAIQSTSLALVPPVSVVIPCWNAARWLPRAIDSAIFDESIVNVIVVNDGSTDGTHQVLQRYEGRIRIVNQANSGPSVARSVGLEMVNTDWVLFLDADDYLSPGALVTWTREASASNADIFFGPSAQETEGQPTLRIRSMPAASSNEEVIEEWVAGVFVPTCSILWRASFLRSIGGWKKHAGRNEDGELMLRALLSQPALSVSQSGLGVYTEHQSTGRVSRRTGRIVLQADIEMSEKLADLAISKGNVRAARAIGMQLYGLAREAYESKANSLGDRSLSSARRAGYQKHSGSFLHSVASSCIGLRGKTALSKLLNLRALRISQP